MPWLGAVAGPLFSYNYFKQEAVLSPFPVDFATFPFSIFQCIASFRLNLLIAHRGFDRSLMLNHGENGEDSIRRLSTDHAGKTINYIDVDVEWIGDFFWYINGIWLLPVQVTLALIILYRNLGAAASAATLFSTLMIMASQHPTGPISRDAPFQDFGCQGCKNQGHLRDIEVHEDSEASLMGRCLLK